MDPGCCRRPLTLSPRRMLDDDDEETDEDRDSDIVEVLDDVDVVEI